MSEKTVFLSYRRPSGSGFARNLHQALTRDGYDVFLDTSNIDAGKWESQILAEVPKRAHFLLLLTPGVLDRCMDPKDWVRREFELADGTGRNVVPVVEDGLDLAKLQENCPEAMRGVFAYQMAKVRYDSFEEDIARLLTRFVPRHKAPAPSAGGSGARIAPSRLPAKIDTFLGRDDELAALDAAWASAETRVVTLVAWGGVGKTSLVAKWAADLSTRSFDGADSFDWSFYSQGTRDQTTASADAFMAEALRFFGQDAVAESAASPWDKGAHLARVLGERRALLVLDGLEPLQHPPGTQRGELKDDGIKALLKGLAAHNAGLCVVTTRESVKDLTPWRKNTAPEWSLERLSDEASVELLKALGVHGAQEDLQQLAKDVQGHALTLNLLGRFLHGAHGGDVRKRDLVRLQEADAEIQSGHAFRVMEAYERWFESEGEPGKRLLAVMRLLGLFDRPATADCLKALRQPPAIEGLTEAIVGLTEAQWNLSVNRLAECGLLTHDAEKLDAHPLVREHFARQLREHQPAAWKAAHGRLFDHLKDTTEHWPDDLAGLQHLYQAVAHGCQAGRQQEALGEVYDARILRGTGRDGFYSTKKLGTFGADLGAVACFFETPWNRVSPALTEADQACLLNQAAFRLRALGRLQEAVEPMRAVLHRDSEAQQWKEAAVSASNLSELELTLGDVADAVRDAEQAVAFADRSGDEFLKVVSRTTLADALHQAGRWEEALACFEEAEAIQAKRQPQYPRLYSLPGFRYCDLLLAGAERAAGGGQEARGSGDTRVLTEACGEVQRRAAQTLEWEAGRLLDIALDHLTLGRARLYRALLEDSVPEAARAEVEDAVGGLRQAGQIQEVPRGLLTRAWLRSALGDETGARADLAEAQEIAERGPMPLFLADIQLYRARLFGERGALAEARWLVLKHGYLRRLGEVEDLEKIAPSLARD